ncbi:tyrosine-type recombinase/integrase, partial [candidate division KSB1 bacterium]|nr:tyrosine-type recombinase/integrase [candidate division KSB1 bacterium]
MQPIQENLKTLKYLTQEEVSRLFSKIHDKRDRAMFNVVYKYGLRASEVGLLKIDDVDLERRRIRVYRLKGGVSGEYGIFSDTARLLKAYLKTRENDFHSALFLSRKKNALSRKTIDDLFREYARKAKLPKDKRHAHTLRHSIAV